MKVPYSIIATEAVRYQPAAASSRSAHLHPAAVSRRSRQQSTVAEGALASIALAFIALAIHGYHPFAEDGGLYYSAVLKSLHPELFPLWDQFVSAPSRYSLFATLFAAVVRISGLRLATAFFLLHLVSIWATIFAGWLVAAKCYAPRSALYGAASLLAVWLTLPIAGSSLLLMDPYVTARSISTPCGLFALAFTLEIAAAIRYSRPVPLRSIAGCLLCVLVAGLVHPLMAGYTVGCLALLLASSRSKQAVRTVSLLSLCFMTVAAAAILARLGPPATPDYLQAAHSRTYWFLQNWHWYEIAGLIAPLLVLDLLAFRNPLQTREATRWLARMATFAGVTATVISLLFVHQSSFSYQVSRVQPLRIYQMIYIVMILAVGAFAGERLFAYMRWSPAGVLILLGAIMFYIQMQTFPASAHIELPKGEPRNGWEQAFAWARTNTPREALFALDANYINFSGEDAQYFSAIAERSALPDYSKDGGLAAIEPPLALGWAKAQSAQSHLAQESDAQRLTALRAFPVDWIVLPETSTTSLLCPYSNPMAKVCLLH